MFVTIIHFCPCLIFASKVEPTLSCKYLDTVSKLVNENTLAYHIIIKITEVNGFIVLAPEITEIVNLCYSPG